MEETMEMVARAYSLPRVQAVMVVMAETLEISVSVLST
jgi:hypothetical protein